uniref:Uncharacterized protein n=1 Tax=Vespula pensylvanica TaxID=30213 RepID=A0A834PCG7_VESPE|nr:hypothetical protein H0235_003698 [Vespula pensylvanica]
MWLLAILRKPLIVTDKSPDPTDLGSISASRTVKEKWEDREREKEGNRKQHIDWSLLENPLIIRFPTEEEEKEGLEKHEEDEEVKEVKEKKKEKESNVALGRRKIFRNDRAIILGRYTRFWSLGRET